MAQHNKQLESGVQAASTMECGVDGGEDKPESTTVGEMHSNENRSEDLAMGYDFDDEIFGISRERAKLTRRQKWIDRRQNGGEPEVEVESGLNRHALEVTSGELADMQEVDETLMAVRELRGHPVQQELASSSEADSSIDGGHLLALMQEMAVEQLILPKQCCKTVLHLAHTIPLAGHMGRDKTTRRILQRFYWPTICD